MSRDVTQLLQRHRNGDASALDSLVALAYDELRVVASRAYAQHGSPGTLQPTVVLHEAWIKVGGHLADVENRQHFFALAARAMRQVLADHGRRNGRAKRGGGATKLSLHEDGMESDRATYGLDDLLELDGALDELKQLNERHAQVVELRVFGALTIREVSELLAVSHGTVENDWATAKAWLHRRLAS